MTDLFDRLFPASSDTPNIPVHVFFSALVDYARGEMTRAQIVAWATLDAEAEADLDVLCDEIDSRNATQKRVFAIELHSVLMLAEAEVKYTTKAAFQATLGL